MGSLTTPNEGPKLILSKAVAMASSRFAPDLDWVVGDLHFIRNLPKEPSFAMPSSMKQVIPVYDIFDSPDPTPVKSAIPVFDIFDSPSKRPKTKTKENDDSKPKKVPRPKPKPKPSSTATSGGISTTGSGGTNQNNNGSPWFPGFGSPKPAVIHTIFNTGGTVSEPGPSGMVNGGFSGGAVTTTGGSSGKSWGGASTAGNQKALIVLVPCEFSKRISA